MHYVLGWRARRGEEREAPLCVSSADGCGVCGSSRRKPESTTPGTTFVLGRESLWDYRSMHDVGVRSASRVSRHSGSGSVHGSHSVSRRRRNSVRVRVRDKLGRFLIFVHCKRYGHRLQTALHWYTHKLQCSTTTTEYYRWYSSGPLWSLCGLVATMNMVMDTHSTSVHARVCPSRSDDSSRRTLPSRARTRLDGTNSDGRCSCVMAAARRTTGTMPFRFWSDHRWCHTGQARVAWHFRMTECPRRHAQ